MAFTALHKLRHPRYLSLTPRLACFSTSQSSSSSLDTTGLIPISTIKFRFRTLIKEQLADATFKLNMMKETGVSNFIGIPLSSTVIKHVVGPLGLPKKTKLYTVNKSTFVHKKARDQFHKHTYSNVTWIHLYTTEENFDKLEFSDDVYFKARRNRETSSEELPELSNPVLSLGSLDKESEKVLTGCISTFSLFPGIALDWTFTEKLQRRKATKQDFKHFFLNAY